MKRIIAGVVVTASLFAAALYVHGQWEAGSVSHTRTVPRSHRATAADLAKLGLPSWTKNAFIDDPPKTVKWSTHYKASWQDSLALALAVFGGAAGVFTLKEIVLRRPQTAS